MRKLLIPALLLTAFSAAPAAAQYRGQGYGYGHGGGAGIQQQLDQLEQRIRQAYDRRLISTREARRLQSQADRIEQLHFEFRRNGLSPRERHELQSRIQNLRQSIRYERQEGREDRRDDRRYDGRYDRRW